MTVPSPTPVSTSGVRFRVVSYNILAELYATKQVPYVLFCSTYAFAGLLWKGSERSSHIFYRGIVYGIIHSFNPFLFLHHSCSTPLLLFYPFTIVFLFIYSPGLPVLWLLVSLLAVQTCYDSTRIRGSARWEIEYKLVFVHTVEWLTNVWLSDRITVWLTHWLIDRLAYLPPDWLTDLLIDWDTE